MGTIKAKKGGTIGPKSGKFNVCAKTEKSNAADSKKTWVEKKPLGARPHFDEIRKIKQK